jgi:hypothetical protein
MSIFKAAGLNALPEFPKREDQLAIVERQVPEGAEAFFQQLMQEPFGIVGQVRKASAVSDIKDILADEIPDTLQSVPFYEDWVSDMAEVCSSFCDTQGSEVVGFWLGSERGCRRYHIDNVPLRALVTYAGTGTEYLPDEAADRRAFAEGVPNEKIIKDSSAIQFMKAWDVAVFRGGSKGLLHRTPDAALNGPSILMRLDHPSFWENILKQQQRSPG